MCIRLNRIMFFFLVLISHFFHSIFLYFIAKPQSNSDTKPGASLHVGFSHRYSISLIKSRIPLNYDDSTEVFFLVLEGFHQNYIHSDLVNVIAVVTLV